jgi:hypothetical protein
LANIRVIFENNSERAAKNAKKTCGTSVSLTLRKFDIREEQGAARCRYTEAACANSEALKTHPNQSRPAAQAAQGALSRPPN